MKYAPNQCVYQGSIFVFSSFVRKFGSHPKFPKKLVKDSQEHNFPRIEKQKILQVSIIAEKPRLEGCFFLTGSTSIRKAIVLHLLSPKTKFKQTF